MPFIYSVDSAVKYTSHATPDTQDPTIVLRQATRGFSLRGIIVQGMVAAGSALNGIGFHVRRWTTAGSGGTSVTPAPRAIGTTASTTAADKQTAITPGTVSGAYQLSFGCGSSGPGGWMAEDAAAEVVVEGGGSDELDINSTSGTTAMPFLAWATIAE